MAEQIRIANAALGAVIDPLGAELQSLTDTAGRELLTDADPAFWTGHAPLLFPIVGALANGEYRLADGRRFAMPQHGFARRLEWALIAHEPGRAAFRLIDSPATRAIYPFPFILDTVYALDGATLSVEVTLANPGEAPLPASIGFHPAFAWPLPGGGDREDHRITFAADEGPFVHRVVDALIGPADRPTPLDGRTLALRDDLFTRDALVWCDVKSGAVRYGASTGPQLDIAFPGAPSLGIWTRPGARFVCVEPWWGHADPAGYDGAFEDKPGMMLLAPGDTRSVAMRVTLVS